MSDEDKTSPLDGGESTDSFIRRKMREERDPATEALARKALVDSLVGRRPTEKLPTLRPGSVVAKKTKEQQIKHKRLSKKLEEKPKAAPVPMPTEQPPVRQATLPAVSKKRIAAPKEAPKKKAPVQSTVEEKAPAARRDPSWHHSQKKKYTLASLRGGELLTQLDRIRELMSDGGPIYAVAAKVKSDMATDTCYGLARCASFSESMRKVIAAQNLNAREAGLIWRFPDELHGYLAEYMQWGAIPYSRLLRVSWGLHEGRDLSELLRGAGFSWPEGVPKSLPIPRR